MFLTCGRIGPCPAARPRPIEHSDGCRGPSVSPDWQPTPAFRAEHQGPHLFLGQPAVLSYLQIADGQRADGHPDQFQHLAAYRFHHAAHLPVTAFRDGDLEHCLAAGLSQVAHDGRTRRPVFQLDAAAEPAQVFLAQAAACFYQVGFRDLVIRIGDALGELRVVGEQQKTAGVQVEAAHRDHTLFEIPQQVVNRGTALRIAGGGEVAFGFVKKQVDLAAFADRAAVELHVVAFEVDPVVGIGDAPAVHLDPAGGDPLPGLDARAKASLRDHALQCLQRALPGRGRMLWISCCHRRPISIPRTA